MKSYDAVTTYLCYSVIYFIGASFKILKEHNALGLKRTGLGVVLDSDKPHLIGLDEDILSTGITLYQLKEGDTIIGNEEAEQMPHILLKGPR